MALTKIISGGQVGADRAGLDWAFERGYAIGGWCPRGRIALDGSIPAKYTLTEMASSSYPDRTAANVVEADATLIFTLEMPLGRGSALTERLCKRHGKPYAIITNFAQPVVDLIVKHNPSVLNIAGTRDERIAKVVPLVMDHALALLRRQRKLAQPKPDAPKKFFARLAPLGNVAVEDGKQTVIFHDTTGMPVKLHQDHDNASVWLGSMQLEPKLAERLADTLLLWVKTGSFHQGS